MDATEKLAEASRVLCVVGRSLEHCKEYVDWPALCSERDDLYQQTMDTRLWDTPDNARALTQKFAQVDSLYKRIQKLSQAQVDVQSFLTLLAEEYDEAALQEMQTILQDLESGTKSLGYEVMLQEPEDVLGCYVCIQSGAGGTDAQDWAEMLLMMYMRYATRKGHRVVVDDYTRGEEAGIKGGVLRIEGRYAFGFLKTESGIHRLVRHSPFNSSGKRHTSFASVLILPIVSKEVMVVIEEKDLRLDTYRASGAGGQHVNKTDSAVRITHLPTGLVVQCQSERSQHRNKDSAMQMLQARLYALEKQKQKEKEDSIEKKSISWGNQIRSYVLHPYRLVKDVRTQVESHDPDILLQGDIDRFLEASLVQKVPVVYSD